MEKKLTLREIAPYLPYGLKSADNSVKAYGLKKPLISNIDTINVMKFIDGGTEAKPILRPLSDLTKDIEHNGIKINPYSDIYNIQRDVEIYRPLNLDHPIELLVNTEDYSQEVDLYDGYLIIQKLLEWQFDIFGLIEKGLAIDINTLCVEK